MIDSVSIRNFKCLRSVDVELEPLTVLIGKNDTGKSSFLEALTVLVDTFDNRAPDATARVTYGAKLDDLELSVKIGGKDFSAKWLKQANTLHSNQRSVGQLPLKGVQPPYRLDPDLLRKPAQVGELTGPLPPKGEHLVAALDRLPMSRFVRLNNDLISRVNTIQEVVLLPQKKGSKEIQFDLAAGGRIRATAVSDGVMLLLAFLTIMHEEDAPPLIMIEEPENGIHPKQLEYVVKSLLSLTQRKDQPIQVILTTHSPYVLDFVPKEAVRVFARDEQGEVVVKPFADIAGIADMLSSGFTLGEAWYNTDEDELIRKGEVKDRTGAGG
jgi:predicted ATPase